MNGLNKTNEISALSIIWQLSLRLITSSVILAITAFFTIGFSISSIWSLLFATITLTLIDYLLVRFLGLQAFPFGRGVIGFALAVITLYLLQFIINGYSISFLAAFFGALIYGVVDYCIPSTLKG